MTHLGLGSSLEDPWGNLLDGVGMGLPSWWLVLPVPERQYCCIGRLGVPYAYNIACLTLDDCLFDLLGNYHSLP